MIIIETKTGPYMINERETIGCSFDKAKGKAIVTYNREPREVVSFHEGTPISKTEYPSVTFTDVEDVIYVTDQNSGAYRYHGSEIERLQKMVKSDISYQTDLMVKCNQQATVIEEYAFFLRRVSPRQKWHKFMKEELELLDKKVREKFPKFNVYFGRNDDNN
jgi:hypothetical protein